jgi:uncharacterized membrane protein YfcA
VHLIKKDIIMTTSIGYLVLGLVAGVLSGLVGIGGGVIIVPALIFFFGMSQHSAQGTTVAMLVLPVGVLGAWVYYRQGFVDISVAALLAAGFFLGSLAGARIAVAVPAPALERVFGVLVVLIGLKMIFGR